MFILFFCIFLSGWVRVKTGGMSCTRIYCSVGTFRSKRVDTVSCGVRLCEIMVISNQYCLNEEEKFLNVKKKMEKRIKKNIYFD